MKLFVKRLHTFFYRGCVLLFFVILFPALYFCSRKPSRYRWLNRLRRWLGFMSSACSGMFYRYEGAEGIDWSRNYIICANHSSNLDITALSLFIRGNFAFMGKDELLNNPVTGLFFRTIDIPLDRNSKMSSYRAFKRAGDYLAQGLSVVIFPEGKIADEYPPVLQDFKAGSFRLALQYQLPILVLSLPDIWKLMWDDGSKRGSRPGISHIFVHSVMETAGMSLDDEKHLAGLVRQTIERGLITKHGA